jgi:hypothetical protein
LIAVSAAGALPYAAGFPCVDMLGLNDYYLPRHKPSEFGAGFIGHELGDGAYIISRKPDIVIFCYPYGGVEAVWKSEKDLVKMGEFNENYKIVNFRTYNKGIKTGTLAWVNIHGKTGMIQAVDKTIIPGYFFGHETLVGDNDEFYTVVFPGREESIDWLKLEPGRYTAEISQADGIKMIIGVKVGNFAAKAESPGRPLHFTIFKDSGKVKIWLQAPDKQAVFFNVVLTKKQ